MGQLDGRVAVVVGASGQKSFGSSIATRLAEAGATVAVAARREEPLRALATRINGLAVACDVTDERQIEHLFAQVRQAYGPVDIAVNCAGGLGGGPIASVTAQDILPTLEVSFIGAILLFKHAAAAMDNGGSMITISSLTARIPGPGLGIYSAARAGIDYILKVAAIEYAQKKIRFNSIAAGLIETDMTAGLLAMPGFADVYTQAIPAGRMGTVDDVAEAALWLADDKASGFVNGQVIDLAGGQQMGKLPG